MRKYKQKILETAIGVCACFGALYLCCAFASLLFRVLGVE